MFSLNYFVLGNKERDSFFYSNEEKIQNNAFLRNVYGFASGSYEHRLSDHRSRWTGLAIILN